jgi:DNA repair exonuclease SbcCD ATPase subunit
MDVLDRARTAAAKLADRVWGSSPEEVDRAMARGLSRAEQEHYCSQIEKLEKRLGEQNRLVKEQSAQAQELEEAARITAGQLREQLQKQDQQVQLLKQELHGVQELAKEQIKDLQEKLAVVSEACKRQTKIARENFEVICSIARQRDQWRQILEIQTKENLTAQGMLGRELVRAREVAIRLLNALNKLRKEHDLKPIKGDQDLPAVDAAPVGKVEEFACRIKALHDRMPEPIELPPGPPPEVSLLAG